MNLWFPSKEHLFRTKIKSVKIILRMETDEIKLCTNKITYCYIVTFFFNSFCCFSGSSLLTLVLFKI